jgi:choline dehydrogenase
VGVEYDQGGKSHTARAGREVILSAGAYGSPQLLMLSGVGPADDLREHGIEPLVDSPNVGRHLMEHPMAFVNWRTRASGTLDDAADPRNLLPWLIAGKGKLSSTVAEAALHWRSEPGLPAPDFQMLFAPVYFWSTAFARPARRRSRSAPPTSGPRAAARCGCAPPTRPTTRASPTTR